ncbi:MAG: hypothetical protein KGS48_01050 [Bacteroidetes bacterium]|nr:hypothetical protein [Bacteroidota bacterium]
MKKHTSRIRCGSFYHIYNRGINGENLFKEKGNFATFFKKYQFHVQPVVQTYAYCLMRNHFHLLVRVRDPIEVNSWYIQRQLSQVYGIRDWYPGQDNHGRVLDILKSDFGIQGMGDELFAEQRVSTHFANFFNSYAQTINRRHGRTGGLFEEVFRRIPVADESHFVQLVCYIHKNPERHKFVKDFREYPYSSYWELMHRSGHLVEGKSVMKWFGDVSGYEQYHLGNEMLHDLDKFSIEFD